MNRFFLLVAVPAAVVVAMPSRAPADSGASPFAHAVVSYEPGAGVDPAYTDPQTALGEPARMSGQGTQYPSVVSPFAAAWEPTDLVSIGRAGHLVVRFDHPVLDDPANPFGIDLLVFGNSFYQDLGGVAGPLFSGGGTVEVSADGLDWRAVGVEADGKFPTLGFSDLTDPYSSVPGAVPSDFTLPVDPAFEPAGKAFSQIVSGYAGSGGGAGIDLGTVGLTSIWFVRISNPADASRVTQIDAMADVTPVPAPWSAALAGLLLIRRRRR